MREIDVSADVMSFNVATSASEKGGQWQQALALPHKVHEAGMAAHLISFSAAILA